MITVEIFSHQTTNGKIVFEEGDFRIVSISPDDMIIKSDCDALEIATFDLNTDDLKPNEWYQFTFKRVYGDDGSGSMNSLSFELVQTVLMPPPYNSKLQVMIANAMDATGLTKAEIISYIEYCLKGKESSVFEGNDR
jgi:hypothetical protein